MAAGDLNGRVGLNSPRIKLDGVLVLCSPHETRLFDSTERKRERAVREK